MKAGGNEEAIQRWEEAGAHEPSSRLCLFLTPAFAALFPVGASSECLFKSLHEAQLLNLFCRTSTENNPSGLTPCPFRWRRPLPGPHSPCSLSLALAGFPTPVI